MSIRFFFFSFFFFLAALGLICGTQDLSLQCVGFSLVVAVVFPLQLWCTGSRAPGLCSCGAWAPECVGSVILQHAGSLVKACELNSCGARVQLPHGMWDLSSSTRDRTHIPCIGRWILYHWITREVPPSVFELIDCAYPYFGILLSKKKEQNITQKHE